jgi:hypothetical protein
VCYGVCYVCDLGPQGLAPTGSLGVSRTVLEPSDDLLGGVIRGGESRSWGNGICWFSNRADPLCNAGGKTVVKGASGCEQSPVGHATQAFESLCFGCQDLPDSARPSGLCCMAQRIWAVTRPQHLFSNSSKTIRPQCHHEMHLQEPGPTTSRVTVHRQRPLYVTYVHVAGQEV